QEAGADGRRRAGIRRRVGLHRDAVRRDAGAHEVLRDEVGDGQELVDHLPGGAVDDLRRRHHSALRARVPITPVLDARPGDRLVGAVLADVAIAVEHAGRADVAIVVHRLHDGDFRVFRYAYDPRRDQWERVVQVHDVRPRLPQTGAERSSVVERVDRAYRHRELFEPTEVRDLVARAQVGVHLDACDPKHLDLVRYYPVFT